MKSRSDKLYSPNDDVWTPPSVFQELNLIFDLDVCSSEMDTHVPALRKFTIKDDGLTQEWRGLVWMNPPYSNPTPWVIRWLEHGNGIAFVPMTRAKWFKSIWDDNRVLITFPQPTKFHFVKPNGDKHGIFMPVVLCAIGETARQALRNTSYGHVR